MKKIIDFFFGKQETDQTATETNKEIDTFKPVFAQENPNNEDKPPLISYSVTGVTRVNRPPETEEECQEIIDKGARITYNYTGSKTIHVGGGKLLE
jgi:hypothetical protein